MGLRQSLFLITTIEIAILGTFSFLSLQFQGYRVNSIMYVEEDRSVIDTLYYNLFAQIKKFGMVEFDNYQLDQSSVNTDCNGTIGNWDFEAGNLDYWVLDTSPTAPRPEIVSPFADNDNGSPFDTCSVRLGDPHGTEFSPLGANGYVIIHRSLKVPSMVATPRLEFDYLMYSYDIIASSTFPYDTLEVAINNLSSIVWQIGNPTPQGAGCLPNIWKSSPTGSTVSIDLSSYVGQEIDVFFILRNQTDNKCNSWAYIDNIKLKPETILSKSNQPSGPVHEGDLITYTIAYANTSLITQNLTLTDVLPFNVDLIPDSVSPPGNLNNSTLVWDLGHVPPGGSGQVSFQVRVPLFSAPGQPLSDIASLSAISPPRMLPVPVACDTTRFWASGVTNQLSQPIPYTIEVQIPPGSNPSKMWLLMKGINNAVPTVGGLPAQLVTTNNDGFGASLWSAAITSTMIADGEVMVTTQNPRQLNAVFLFNAEDPPFDESTLDIFFNSITTTTYSLDTPSVDNQTIDVILPLLDITYFTDGSLPKPDTRLTKVTAEFNGQHHTVLANDPNMGNGLLMTQFPFEIGPLSEKTVTKILTVTVDTEDSIYMLSPRICRPVYVENIAILCSNQAGCISDTARNIPEKFSVPNGIYLPLIFKSYS